jgi:hypothetical protein
MYWSAAKDLQSRKPCVRTLTAYETKACTSLAPQQLPGIVDDQDSRRPADELVHKDPLQEVTAWPWARCMPRRPETLRARGAQVERGASRTRPAARERLSQATACSAVLRHSDRGHMEGLVTCAASVSAKCIVCPS